MAIMGRDGSDYPKRQEGAIITRHSLTELSTELHTSETVICKFQTFHPLHPRGTDENRKPASIRNGDYCEKH
jgi:hypothetical protein